MAIPYSSVHTGAGVTAEKCSFAATGVVGSEAVRAGSRPPDEGGRLFLATTECWEASRCRIDTPHPKAFPRKKNPFETA